MTGARRVSVAFAALIVAAAVALATSAPLAIAATPLGPIRQTANTGGALIAQHDAGCPDGRGRYLTTRAACLGDHCDYQDVVLVRIDAHGHATERAIVNESDPAHHYRAAIACSEDAVTVAWLDHGGCAMVRRFDLDGEPLTGGQRVGGDAHCDRRWDVLRGASGGRFAALQMRSVQEANGLLRGHYLQLDLFDSAAHVIAWGVRASEYLSRDGQADVGVASDGTMLVAWSLWTHPGISARLLDAHGRATTDSIRIDSDGVAARVIALDDGTFDIFWEDSSRGGLVGRRFSADPDATTTTTTSTTSTTLADPDAIEFDGPTELRATRSIELAGDPATGLIALVDMPGAFGLLASTDAGRSWSNAAFRSEPPAAIEAGGDTWVMAFSKNYGGPCNVAVERSTDHGESWESASLWDTWDPYVAATCSYVRLKTDGKGTWLAAWTVNRYADEQSTTIASAMVAVSRDDGSTWGATTVFEAANESFDDTAAAIGDHGNAIVGWIRRSVAEPSSFVISRSTDSGSTWTAPHRLSAAGAGSQLELAPLAGGVWVAAWSNALPEAGTGYDMDVFVSRSTDDGATWSAAAPVAPFAFHDEANDKDPRVAVADGGHVLVAWTSYFDLHARLDTDGDALAVRSRDGARTWSAPRPVNAGAAGDSSWDWLAGVTSVGDGSWGALWTSGSRGWRPLFATSRAPGCADGDLAASEECDDRNSIDGDGCDSNCRATGCGNTVVTAGEECDDGNYFPDDGCSPQCRTTYCGDGVVDVGAEECDDGNAADDDACRTSCVRAACGDGIVWPEGGEACDDGNLDEGDGCEWCTIPRCGDQRYHSNEDCDDGNDIDFDECLTTCRWNTCGDSFPGGPGETCDDGNRVDGDGCDRSCRPTGCGSGVVTGDEECDDGRNLPGGLCLPACIRNVCGDGVLLDDPWMDPLLAEQCDDGNLADGDGCDSNCKTTGCGNGVAAGAEHCDDGNQNNADGCLTVCVLNVCGDGEMYVGVEACDDGNRAAGDGCSPECMLDGECGDADSNGVVTATDARQVLLRATNAVLDCPSSVCDVNRSGLVDTSDALGTLRFAVGLYDETVCLRSTQVVFRLEDAVEIGALQLAVAYGDAPAYFLGDSDAAQCTPLVPGLSSFNHDVDVRVLTGGIINVSGFTGPTDVASCILMRYGPWSSVSLDVVVQDAAAPDLTPVSARVTAEER